MMTLFTLVAAPAVRGEPSPLLRHLAGEHAPRVAGLWPAPHGPFIGASADRRHLVCLALSHPDERIDREAADGFLRDALRRAVGMLGPDTPAGLARALAHMGEVAWTADDYRRLEAALRVDALAARLRHAKLITPDSLRVLDALPPALHGIGLGGESLSGAQAQVLAEAFEALRRRDGEAVALDQARAWAAGSSLKDVFTRAEASLEADPAAPPFPGTDALRGLSTRAALLDAAGRYRNCLATYQSSAALGTCALYEWTGEPGAVVQIIRDVLFGWRLQQARIANNQPVPLETRAAINAELESWGVHVGYGVWDLQNALSQAYLDTFERQTVEACVAEYYGD
jgi:hypothetical protein